MNSASHPPVCIIGAGPYGLAIAAHLQSIGTEFRIFGSPMHRWLSQMPRTMFLKSEGCASSLFHPAGLHTLEQYCLDKGLPYSAIGNPVSREVFAQYAVTFQRKIVPNVDDVMVTSVHKLPDGFELRLSSNETLGAKKVIVATGMDYAAYVPEQIARLPAELRSHSADHYDLGIFKGKDVAVIGGGQSALETVAILREEGASATLLARAPSLMWNSIPSTARRSLYERILRPRARLGDGLGQWVYDNVPGLFHRLPLGIRQDRARKVAGPAGAWWLKDRVAGRLPLLVGHHVREAEARGGRVALQIADQNDRRSELITDHVIAATGYQFKVENLPFLDQSLKNQIQRENQTPLLSSNFESSVGGLYFTGLASMNAFGPSMRFLVGADFTARRVSSHVGRELRSRIPRFAKTKKCPEF